jgi:hypothetical protein
VKQWRIKVQYGEFYGAYSIYHDKPPNISPPEYKPSRVLAHHIHNAQAIPNISFPEYNLLQALKYRSVTDIVRPIREIVRHREETTGHSV